MAPFEFQKISNLDVLNSIEMTNDSLIEKSWHLGILFMRNQFVSICVWKDPFLLNVWILNGIWDGVKDGTCVFLSKREQESHS